jgi:hypothetical protein
MADVNGLIETVVKAARDTISSYIEGILREIKDLQERIGKLEKLHYRGVAPIDERGYHNWPEPKPYTCGECRHPWRTEGNSMLICFERFDPN